MKIVAFAGDSGSGKTTAIAALIRHFVSAGQSVAAIKHTHHPMNEEDRGDTAVFRRAGADPVILAGAGQAVIFSGEAPRRIAFNDPRELVHHIETGIVFIEGFKSLDVWPRVTMDSGQRQTTEELLAILDRIWRS